MRGPYTDYAEQLWRSWLARTIQVPAALHRIFSLEAAPEPYVRFRAGANPLVVLLTNPGGVLPQQLRTTVESGLGPINPAMDYASVASAMGEFYLRELRGPAAHRIAAFCSVSEQLGMEGVLQVDACPFHSASLPNKNALLRIIRAGGILQEYAELLGNFLHARPVLTLSAVSSAHPLQAPPVVTDWARWQAGLAGLRISDATLVPLVVKGSTTTVAALVGRTAGVPKAMVLMMGGNRLPGRAGLGTLTTALA